VDGPASVKSLNHVTVSMMEALVTIMKRPTAPPGRVDDDGSAGDVSTGHTLTESSGRTTPSSWGKGWFTNSDARIRRCSLGYSTVNTI
jgi:hypothetical protein